MMNKTLIAMMVSLALAGCGGGGSDKNTAAEPPAPEMPSGNSGGGAAPDPDLVPLSMNCFKQPSGTINSGNSATATFKVSESINATGTVSMSCPGANTEFASSLLNVNSGNGLVSQSVPEDCEGVNFNITLKLNEENLSATCSWPVNEQLDFQLNP